MSRGEPGPSQYTESVPAQFMRLPVVMRITGLGRLTIYRLIAEKRFPRPVQLAARTVGWRRADLERWSAARETVDH